MKKKNKKNLINFVQEIAECVNCEEASVSNSLELIKTINRKRKEELEV